MPAPAPAEFQQRLRARSALRHEDIGGGKVRQGFRMGAEFVRPGTILTREQILAIPYQNRVALITRFIEVWPKEASPPENLRRFMVHMGAGKFNVIEGVQLNDEPLSKEEAEEMKNSS